MGHTSQSISKGDYAYSSHSVLVSGDIVDVFVGRWEWQNDDTRVLRKYPIEEEGNVVGGEMMCVLKLRRPMTMAEYRESHHPDFRPMAKPTATEVELVLLPTSMACTIPDAM